MAPFAAYDVCAMQFAYALCLFAGSSLLYCKMYSLCHELIFEDAVGIGPVCLQWQIVREFTTLIFLKQIVDLMKLLL